MSSSMPEVYDALAARLKALLDSNDKPQYLVGVAGMPGAGKSTITSEVCAKVNALAGAEVAVVVPMDGYHYTRAQLDAMSQPALAHARRGAHWTFDERAFVDMVRTLREEGAVSVPSFDHAVGDPVPDAIHVSRSTPLVLVEGNYLMLEYWPWSELPAMFDETWFIACDVDEAMRRVEQRHVGTGVSAAAARQKVETNDRVNAQLIGSTSARADVLVPSIPLPPPPAPAATAAPADGDTYSI